VNLSLYFHTIRHLRPVQVYGRIVHRFYRPRPDLSPPPQRRPLSGCWSEPLRKDSSMLSKTRFRFLNVERELSGKTDWNQSACDKLWLYNLHYFDDLNAQSSRERSSWHRELICRWINENPPGQGTGWEPYPLSLRIVNWIKWALDGNTLPDGMLLSLAVQVRHLSRSLEYHLLGNHLFANAKALLYAGHFFLGNEAERWVEKGAAILAKELPEQILADGGHFERSPMYHAIILEDLLDLINVTRAYPDAILPRWRHLPHQFPGTVARMHEWLQAMSHPDGEIAFFNDAALGIAPSPEQLRDYSHRLRLPAVSPTREGITHLRDSGYIRLQKGCATVILDVGEIGPDYLPGHAHADTLSFEFSLNRERVIVNSGTSCYGFNAVREYQRSSAAHNTLVINGLNSSETWGSFRVGRRAKPFDLVVRDDGNKLIVECAHNGYRHLAGSPVHKRTWQLSDIELQLHDSVSGSYASAESRFHFHPSLGVVPGTDGKTGNLELRTGTRLSWTIKKNRGYVEDATYHPGFGLTCDAKNLTIAYTSASDDMITFGWR